MLETVPEELSVINLLLFSFGDLSLPCISFRSIAEEERLSEGSSLFSRDMSHRLSTGEYFA
jgi:hypothetical protein